MFVNVPATIMMSDCRGLARNTTPSLSWSYRAAAMCIISTAQHAKPNVIGHIEPWRPQLAILSNVDRTYSVPQPRRVNHILGGHRLHYRNIPALFCGSRTLNCVDPRSAMVVIGSFGFVEYNGASFEEVGLEECKERRAKKFRHKQSVG